MKSLPLPIRVAAGLAVTAVEQARTLPAKIAGLPVTVASQALQVSMRVQQQVTELAIRGDEVLASFRPVEETPEWATFDEDVENGGFDGQPTPFESAFDRVEDEPVRRNGYYTGSTETLATPDPWTQEERAFAEETGVLDESGYGSDEPEDDRRDSGPGGGSPTARAAGGPALVEGADDRPILEVVGADRPPAEDADGDGSLSGVSGTDPSPSGDGREDQVSGEGLSLSGDAGEDQSSPGGGAEDQSLSGVGGEGRAAAEGDSGDRPLFEVAGYDELSLPQLRARLRRFNADELGELLEYERAHGNRPSFVGMLTRRIAAVRDQR